MSQAYQRITDGILEELRNGCVPWVKPWRDVNAGGMPYNAVSQRQYNGVNVLQLWAAGSLKGYRVPGWLTFKQAKELGGTVRKGEHGAYVVWASQVTKTKTDDAGNETTERFPVLKGYTVFNIAQCDGLPDRLYPAPVEIPDIERIKRADVFISKIGASVHHGGDRAFYAPGPDIITLPEPGQFSDVAHYYATSLHEHGHWTGAKHRLDRTFGKRFGDQKYAAEELVAELTAAFLCAHVGLEARLQHASYIESWIKLLGEYKTAIFTAAARATDAANYLKAFSETADMAA